MPYKSEKIRLDGLQDRRRKLSYEDVEAIKAMYIPYEFGAQKIAKIFGVSKKTVLMIVSEQTKQTSHKYVSEHWKEFQRSKDERAAIMREHRHYKQSLYLSGELQAKSEQAERNLP